MVHRIGIRHITEFFIHYIRIRHTLMHGNTGSHLTGFTQISISHFTFVQMRTLVQCNDTGFHHVLILADLHRGKHHTGRKAQRPHVQDFHLFIT